MRYPYKCNECNTDIIINKPMSEATKEEKCLNCDTEKPMQRVYTSPSTKTSDGFKK